MDNNRYEVENYFFIDYENVNKDGLNGVTGLDEKDRVRIYYSANAETITFGLHRRINSSKASFEYVKVDLPIKNAVDCKLLFDIQDYSKKGTALNYFIVSKDMDFDKSVKQMKDRGINISKIGAICSYKEGTPPNTSTDDAKSEKNSKEKKRENQVRTFFGQHFKEKTYKDNKEQIISAILESNNKSALNNRLQKIFPGTEVKKILQELKPFIKDLPSH